MIDLPRCIREQREARGLRQFELARRAEMSPAQLCQIENGRVSPSFHMVERLARALDLDVVELISSIITVHPKRKNTDAPCERSALTDFIPLRAVEPDAQRVIKMISDEEVEFDAMDDARGVPSDCRILLNRVRLSCAGAGASLAEELRADLGLGTAPLGNFASALEIRGVRIHRVKMPKASLSVAFWNRHRSTVVIALNDSVTRERELYRLVYELGSASLFVSLGKRQLDESLEQHRFLTDFTSAFLMPGVMVRTYVAATGIGPADWTFDSLVGIKSHFGVSAESFALRLEELGLINASLRLNLRDRLRAYYKAHPKDMEPRASSCNGLRSDGFLKKRRSSRRSLLTGCPAT